MRKKLLAIALAAMLIPFGLKAQTLNNNYYFSTGVDSAAWIELTDSATFLNIIGDDVASSVNDIGFNFQFCGVTYTQWSGNSNGRLKLGGTVITTDYSNPFTASNISTNLPCFAFIGCDGHLYTNDYAKFETVGEEGERILVVEYHTSMHSYEGTTFDVQIQFSEADYSIQYVYGPRTGAPSRAYQIGITSSTTDLVMVNVSDNTASHFDGGSSQNNPSGVWPDLYRYYKFTYDSTACIPPSGIFFNSITPHGAQVTWHPGTNSQSFFLEVPAAEIAVEVTDTVYDLSDLAPGTTYNVFIRSICEDQDSSIPISASFQTDILCYPVNNVRVLSFNRSAIAIGWDYDSRGNEHTGVTATIHKISDGDDHSNDQTLTTTYDHCIFYGLDLASNYIVSIVTDCGEDPSQPTTLNCSTQGCETLLDNGTNNIGHTPFRNQNAYSYHQSLFLHTEAPDPIITGISYKVGSTAKSQSSLIRVYMGNTDMTQLGTSAYVPASDLTLVADSVTLPAAASGTWLLIPFDTAFYNDGRNVVVAIHNITGNSNGAGNWRGLATSGRHSSIYNESISSTDTPATITSFSTTDFLPSIKFHVNCEDASCMPPLAMIDDAQEDQVTLSWVPGGTENLWSVEYKKSTETEWSVAETSTASLSTTITDLEQDILYQFRIGALCTSGDTVYALINQRTPCGTLPDVYIEDFEGYETNGHPQCWTIVSTYNSYPYLYNQINNAAYGIGHVRSSGTTSQPSILASPLVPHDADDIYVTFWARAVLPGSGLEAGVMTDLNSPTSFIPLTVTATGNYDATTQYYEYEFFTNGLEIEDSVYVAFRWTSSTEGRLDYITISSTPSCTRPMLSVENVSATEATISITDASDVNHYKLFLAEDSVEVNGNSYTFTSLPSSTLMTLSAVTLCDDGSRTMPVSVTFQTSCVGLTALPYTMDFEGQPTGSGSEPPICWTRGDNSTAYPYVINNSSNAHNSTNSLYLYGANYTMALPPVDTTEIDLTTAQLAFYARHGGTATNIEVGVMSNPSSSSTFQSLASVNITSATHEIYEVPLTGYNPSMGAYIAFRSTSSINIYVDDVSLEYIPSCTRPVITSATSTTTEATIEWTSTSTNFVLYYSSGNDEPDSIVVTDSDSIHTATISNLSPASSYTVYIITTCEDGLRLQGSSYDFRTACDVITALPWTENFDGYGYLFTSYTSQISATCFPCWDVLYAGTSTRLSLCPGSNQYNYGSQGYTPFFYPGVAHAQNILILPPFAENISNLKMSFFTRPEGTSSSPGVFYVGYITDITDSSTFVPVQTYTTSQFSGIYLPDTVTFENAPAGARIAFSHRSNTNNYYWYFDDIVVSMADTTAQPTQYTVSAESADLSMGTASCTPSGLVNVGTQVTATAVPATGYQFVSWTDGTTVVSTQNPYTFTVSNDVALTATFAVEVGIDGAESSALSIFPNPASTEVIVSGVQAGDVLSIVDLNGRTLAQYTAEGSALTLSLSEYPAGTYFVRVVGAEQVNVQKLIVR